MRENCGLSFRNALLNWIGEQNLKNSHVRKHTWWSLFRFISDRKHPQEQIKQIKSIFILGLTMCIYIAVHRFTNKKMGNSFVFLKSTGRLTYSKASKIKRVDLYQEIIPGNTPQNKRGVLTTYQTTILRLRVKAAVYITFP